MKPTAFLTAFVTLMAISAAPAMAVPDIQYYNLTASYGSGVTAGTVDFYYSVDLNQAGTSYSSGPATGYSFGLTSLSTSYTGVALSSLNPAAASIEINQYTAFGTLYTLFASVSLNPVAIALSSNFTAGTVGTLADMGGDSNPLGRNAYLYPDNIYTPLTNVAVTAATAPNTDVPEPASIVLVCAGIAGLAAARRRRAA